MVTTHGSSASPPRSWSGCGSDSTIRRRLRETPRARGALPIWADFISQAARALPARQFAVPDGLREETLCSVSYQKPTELCPIYREHFKDDDVPSETCRSHRAPSIGDRVRDAMKGWLDRLRGVFR